MSTKKEMTASQGCLYLIAFAAVIVGSSILFAITLAQMYNWFVVSAMQVHPINFYTAIGLSTMVRLMQPFPKTPTNEETQKAAEERWSIIAQSITKVVTACAMAFVIGWVCHRMST